MRKQKLKSEFLSSSAEETHNFGKDFAKEILKTGLQKNAVVLCLRGELGGGKTAFTQGFAKGLGVKERVLSPTFVIMKRFKINNNFKALYHFDCYRIRNPKEMAFMGFKEIISNPKNIVVIEWAENIKKALPKDSIWIDFEVISESQRRLIVYK
jgi:tRNA threonylcarbamoyladenosine biosynthesis protein TsaE